MKPRSLRAPLLGLALMLICAGCSRIAVPPTAQPDKLLPLLQRKDISERVFTEIYASAARQRYPDADLAVVGPLEIKGTIQDQEVHFFLDNFWRDTKEGQGDQAASLERFLGAVVETVKNADLEPTKDIVVPVVKGSDFIDGARRQMGAKFDLAVEPLVSDLWIVYVADLPAQVRYLNWERIHELGISRTGVRELSLTNLRRILPEVHRVGSGPVFMLTCGGNYEASLLLATSIWDSQAQDVPGDLVAVVPNRDMLIFTGSGSPEGLALLRDLVDRSFSEGAYPVSKNLLLWSEHRWQSFQH